MATCKHCKKELVDAACTYARRDEVYCRPCFERMILQGPRREILGKKNLHKITKAIIELRMDPYGIILCYILNESLKRFENPKVPRTAPHYQLYPRFPSDMSPEDRAYLTATFPNLFLPFTGRPTLIMEPKAPLHAAVEFTSALCRGESDSIERYAATEFPATVLWEGVDVAARHVRPMLSATLDELEQLCGLLGLRYAPMPEYPSGSVEAALAAAIEGSGLQTWRNMVNVADALVKKG
ncbi:hypothetical protein J8273_2849 [Carpediemonas membranifera]|uniref:Uncharacterized protein n=1 Tax=Carpediemonas membranifera TaxID=201153 RepID=A0A8J6AYP8_9EUKA|nr:hypothetical protein J8273_2849 [Carpediemonas membranifera]|eukprot:KAG9395645.1 hypothetical protein J8273_2849 [Carpediemonas membranifera]